MVPVSDIVKVARDGEAGGSGSPSHKVRTAARSAVGGAREPGSAAHAPGLSAHVAARLLLALRMLPRRTERVRPVPVTTTASCHSGQRVDVTDRRSSPRPTLAPDPSRTSQSSRLSPLPVPNAEPTVTATPLRAMISEPDPLQARLAAPPGGETTAKSATGGEGSGKPRCVVEHLVVRVRVLPLPYPGGQPLSRSGMVTGARESESARYPAAVEKEDAGRGPSTTATARGEGLGVVESEGV